VNRARSGAARWLPAVLAAISIGMTAAGAVLMVANGQPILGTFNLDLIVVGSAFVVVGAMLCLRVPGNRLGWLFLAAGITWSADLLLAQVAWFGAVVHPGSLSGTWIATWLSNWLWLPGTALLLFGVPLLFPDGHLPSPRWRPVAILGVLIVAGAVLGQAAAAWPLREGTLSLSPGFDATAAPGLAGILASIGNMGTSLLLPALAVAALVARYRAAAGLVRQQLRWFTASAIAAVVLVLGDLLVQAVAPGAMGLMSAAGFMMLPAGLGIAILRYRLYDLDRIISRTVAWALVTGLLVGVFVVVVVTLEAVLAPLTSESTLAVAISTLVAFAIFQPLRRRVQRAVDRRFNRSRYDARNTASSFAQRLRSETEMDLVMRDLASVTASAVAPASFAVWLRPKALGR
jgi:hypothetical protein